jgi:hypothetical protein
VRVVRDTTFNGVNINKFSATKVPMQCPLVLIKIGSREGKAFGSGEGRTMRSGARRKVEQDPTAFDWTSEFLH